LYILLLFVALSLAWLWPLPTRLATRIAHDPGDPVLNTWILWWSTQALPFTQRWWDAPIFHPMEGAFALSEHLAGIALFIAPLAHLGLNAVAAYNLALITACALSGFFTYLLVRHLTGSTVAGIVAGIAFAFAPYRGSQLAHLQVLNAQWMPLALLAMHRYLAGGSRGWLAALAIAWLFQALSNGYFLLFFPVLVALWLAWFGTAPAAPGAPSPRGRAAALIVTLAGASLPLVPVLLRYKAVHSMLGITRSVDEMIRFSASPASFLHAAPLAAFWPEAATRTQETYLFPGLTVLLLAVGAVVLVARGNSMPGWVRYRAPLPFYLLAAVLMLWLTIGPAPDGSGAATLLYPYTALNYLPGFDGLRAPARYATLAILCLAVVAGLTTSWLTRLRRPLRVATTMVILVGLFVDGWIEPVPLVAPPPRIMLPALKDAVVVELPAHDLTVKLGAMYRSISHRLPLVNGFSGHTPTHYSVLNTAILRGDPSVLWWLAGGRPLIMVVHRSLDTDGSARAYVEAAGGVLHEESGLGPVYILAPRPRDRRTPQVAALTGVQATQPAPAITVVDLGAERIVRAITFAVRWRHAEVPERMTVEVSSDGSTWSTAWENWTGALVLSAAIDDQRDVIVEIPVQDARARYIRIQPSPRWLPGELRVHAATSSPSP
jgi:hypothetical protein